MAPNGGKRPAGALLTDRSGHEDVLAWLRGVLPAASVESVSGTPVVALPAAVLRMGSHRKLSCSSQSRAARCSN